MKKMRTYLTVLTMSAFVLAACGGTDDTNDGGDDQQGSDEAGETEGGDDDILSEEEVTEPSEDGVLHVSFGLGESEWAVFRTEILPAFEEMTGIEVRAVQVESGDLVNKLTAEIDADNVTIDMFAQDVNHLTGLVSRDLVEDLSDYRDVVPDSVIDGMMEVSEFEDELLFLPYRPNVEITFFNEEKFDEYGIDLPRNWDDLLETAQALEEETGQGRVAIKGILEDDTVLHMFDFIRSAGGDPHQFNDEGSIEAMTFLQELWPHLSEQSTTANWDTMNQYLENDSIYLGKNWPFYIGEFHANGKDEIQAYAGWEGPEGMSHALGGEVIGIPRGSENVDEAIQFAEFLMSQEVQELLVSELAWPAVRSDAYGLVQGYQEPYFEAIRDALEHAEPRGNVPYWENAEQIYIDAFQQIVVNGEDVESTLNNAAAEIEELREDAE
ncbi:sugar ABC transporter substrate-binding protein [Alteribacter keqinensis]|uniref:Extracellular solute-binding protein n=1 Tax=Alteribacter keqinensis TaxID=2483800 RepID=A0A3M7TPY9_9BACI|nr:extracellular solute-binding protein [Alteribacter keqinensis]RNA67618.1 extracellular solute-binding protein [Alteribacter keqinensis]